MLGIVNKQNLTAGAEATATAALTRLVARTSVSSIKTAFDKAGQFKDATFKVTGIYLKNANSSVNAEKTAVSLLVGVTRPINTYMKRCLHIQPILNSLLRITSIHFRMLRYADQTYN
mgnify:CR=1 FL=1